MSQFSDAELTAYLDELLPAAAMAQVEQAARGDASVLSRLAELLVRRDSGVHSLADIWRRNRLSCPTREQWGSYLLGVLEPDEAGYYVFHVEVAGCRICQANLADLSAEQAGQPPATHDRRRKYFQSSAGRLKKRTLS